MTPFELMYSNLVEYVLDKGEVRSTRNGETKSVFATSLRFSLEDGTFPLLQGRQIFYKGVLGELAAIFRRPTTTADFAEFGCNYWRDWGDSSGNINIDYGNAWFDFNGFDQIAELKRLLKEDPHSRRILINGWRPDNVASLSLPCCHYSYQFYVRDSGHIDMLWTQRSADLMVGVPSDAVFAAAWLIAIAKEFGFKPGVVTMQFGDTHIYAEHYNNAYKYVANTLLIQHPAPIYVYTGPDDFTKFKPEDLEVLFYKPVEILNFKLKV